MTLKSADNPPVTYPTDLFEFPVSGDRPWRVARTKSRQEKALAWSLKASGIRYFLPLVSRPQKNKKRMRTSIVPLFNGYLFFQGDMQERYTAITSGRIAQIIEVQDQQTLTRELTSLAQATAAECQLELCDFATKGKRVRIIDGPFRGLEGIVKKQKGQRRLVLQIEAIRQAATVEIELDQAQPT